MNPEVVVEMNPHSITGGNRAWGAGLDHARIFRDRKLDATVWATIEPAQDTRTFEAHRQRWSLLSVRGRLSLRRPPFGYHFYLFCRAKNSEGQRPGPYGAEADADEESGMRDLVSPAGRLLKLLQELHAGRRFCIHGRAAEVHSAVCAGGPSIYRQMARPLRSAGTGNGCAT